MFWDHMQGWSHGGGWWMWLGMLVFWGLIITGLVLLFRMLAGGKGEGSVPRDGDDTAQEIVKKRYARGEISREEYERLKNDLKD